MNKYILHVQKMQYFYKSIKSVFHSLIFAFPEENFYVYTGFIKYLTQSDLEMRMVELKQF